MVHTRTRTGRLTRFSMHTSSSGARLRTELLFPLPPSRISYIGPRSKVSKPLPATLRASDSNPQLDPTFLLRYPVPQGRHPSFANRSNYCSTCAVAHIAPTGHRGYLRRHTDAWSTFVPSKPSNSASSTNIGTELTPPPLLQTPMSTYSAYEPVVLIGDYAT